jgi:hypothetical protein
MWDHIRRLERTAAIQDDRIQELERVTPRRVVEK